MKCKHCGTHYAWYQDVDGCCSPACANARAAETAAEGKFYGAIIWFIIKLFMIPFPYILLIVSVLRHPFPGIINCFTDGSHGFYWACGIFSVIYGVLFLLSRLFSGEKWADVMRIVLFWVKGVGIFLTVVILIYCCLLQERTGFDIVSFMLGV